MVWGMLWIIGVYGGAAICLHLAHRISRRRSGTHKVIFALVTHNNGTEIEWYLRSLMLVSKLRGRHISIVMFDHGSTDETLLIARRIADDQAYAELRISEAEQLEAFLLAHANEAIVLHRLDWADRKAGLAVLEV